MAIKMYNKSIFNTKFINILFTFFKEFKVSQFPTP